jgi:hypothetical protein
MGVLSTKVEEVHAETQRTERQKDFSREGAKLAKLLFLWSAYSPSLREMNFVLLGELCAFA